ETPSSSPGPNTRGPAVLFGGPERSSFIVVPLLSLRGCSRSEAGHIRSGWYRSQAPCGLDASQGSTSPIQTAGTTTENGGAHFRVRTREHGPVREGASHAGGGRPPRLHALD